MLWGFSQLLSVLRLIVTSLITRIQDAEQLRILRKFKSRVLVCLANFMQTSPVFAIFQSKNSSLG